MAYNLKDEEDVKLYIHNLGIEYRFGCFHEKRPEVCHLLGDYLEAIKKDFEKAYVVFKSNCDDYKYAKSCFKFGGYSVLGRGAKEADKEQGYKYFMKACELGEAGGCLSAAIMNIKEGPHSRKDRDPKLGMSLLEKCCEGGRSYCCFYLSGMYIRGVKECQIERDLPKAFQLTKKACELGEMYACANLAQMYKHGDGTEKNEELAAKYQKIAEEIQDELVKQKPPLEFQQGI